MIVVEPRVRNFSAIWREQFNSQWDNWHFNSYLTRTTCTCIVTETIFLIHPKNHIDFKNAFNCRFDKNLQSSITYTEWLFFLIQEIAKFVRNWN